MSAVLWQRIEGGLVFAACIAMLYVLGVGPWWLWLVVFFAPDLGFLGYLGGPKLGAAVYNTLHLYGLWLALVALGLTLLGPYAATLGLLWTAHVGFDRMLGYGLKQPTAFADTHLGRIGRK